MVANATVVSPPEIGELLLDFLAMQTILQMLYPFPYCRDATTIRLMVRHSHSLRRSQIVEPTNLTRSLDDLFILGFLAWTFRVVSCSFTTDFSAKYNHESVDLSTPWLVFERTAVTKAVACYSSKHLSCNTPYPQAPTCPPSPQPSPVRDWTAHLCTLHFLLPTHKPHELFQPKPGCPTVFTSIKVRLVKVYLGTSDLNLERSFPM